MYVFISSRRWGALCSAPVVDVMQRERAEAQDSAPCRHRHTLHTHGSSVAAACILTQAELRQPYV